MGGRYGSWPARPGQALGYDALRRLLSWQNTTTSPTQTASYASDGEGNRVRRRA
ncbi:MAG: hypothetical protein IVW57_16425 [Ktedonobacterales bacterium]|nr:hypothetical protein [Ktedonobacterales bacterium]